MKKVIIMKGLPGSGKSTLAKKMVDENPGAYKRLNKDELRMMLDNNHHSTANEKFVEKVRDLMMIEALKAGKHVIIDDTNMSERPVARIKQLVTEYNKTNHDQVQVEIKEMQTSLEECIERDEKREKKVGKKVIMQMYTQHILGDDRGPHYQPQDKKLPAAIICDLDGTLAIMTNRSPFDDIACETDALNEPVASILKTYQEKGTQVLFMSGRMERSREATERWLKKHGIIYHGLFMRATNDMRKDAVIKKELFEKHVRNRFFIEFVLDDRDQVVDLWRLDLGLPCLQVNYGNF